MYKLNIVDDEQKSIDNLIYLLKEYISDELEISSYTDPRKATLALESEPPDLLFLDIQMPGFSGFDLLKSLKQLDFSVIFTTAHSEFAIEAIKHSAFDYLLKPIDDELLVQSFQRFKAMTQQSNRSVEINELHQLIKSQTLNQHKRITINSSDGLHYINTADIMRIEADGNYSAIYLEDGSKYLSSKNLKSYEDILPHPPFIRAHYSHLVNREYVRSLIKSEILVLKNNAEIPISRRRKKDIKELLNE